MINTEKELLKEKKFTKETARIDLDYNNDYYNSRMVTDCNNDTENHARQQKIQR